MFRPQDYPDLLVGLGDPDDAAVWRLDEERALVVTTDFFTPVVDDPYDYGAVAAANALSDIYAMGGTPVVALNLACLPSSLPPPTSSEVFRGGGEKVQVAGWPVGGGHAVSGQERLDGLAGVGMGDPRR